MTERIENRQAQWRRVARRLADFLEYLLMLAVLLECNSMYTYAAETVGRVDMPLVFYRLSVLLAALALALRLWLNPRPLKKRLRGGPVLVALLVWAAAFFVLNAARQEDWKRESYVMNFLLFLPLMTALFKAKQRQGQGLDLFFKFSDIVCVLAALSLAVYLASVLRPDSVQADLIYTRWNNRHAVTPQINLLDVCQSVLRAKWSLLGVSLLRNRSVFTEPLMFALPLLIALYTEMFLRDRACRWRVTRWLILSAALVSASATIALMLMAAAWGIKGVSALLARGKRWLVIPILVIALATCGALVLEKGRSSLKTTDTYGNSVSTHLDDYSASFKAFAKRPLLGVGYLNEEGIFSYFQAYRLDNPGLSNTAGTILAEGGLMLGLLCMLPFLIWLLYLFRRRDWRVACWGFGMFGAYVGIIFKYHLLLMLLFAFGYSLLGVDRTGRKLALVDTNAQRRELPPTPRRRGGLPVWAQLAGVALIDLVLALFGAPVWSALHTFLRGHQFSVGMVPLRAFCFAIALLTHGIAVRRATRGEIGWARLALLAAWDALYLLAYPLLFSGVNTMLGLCGLWGELRECALLLAIWLLPAAFVLLVQPKRWMNRRGAILAGAVVALAGACVLATNLAVAHRAGAEDALVPELEDLAAHATGPLYVNDLPLLYHRQVKGVGLPATRDSGFEVQENVSVVFGERADRRELLEYGFQVARLEDGHLLYTNDAALIDHLRARGAKLYRYYPFGTLADLEALAELNGREMTQDGALIVNGPVESLSSGPYDTLFAGDYAAIYTLHIDPKACEGLPADTQLCRAELTWYYGEASLASMPVTLDAFDADGNAEVTVPFNAPDLIDGVEYLLIGEADFVIEVRSIELKQTPAYVTVTDYNSRRDPIRECYFNADGTPCCPDGTYAILERDFDAVDRLTGLRYLDADGNPTLVGIGYAEVRYRYDRRGWPDYVAYYGTDGKPIMTQNGYAAIGWVFDAYGNAEATYYYDTEGNLIE